MKNLLSLKQGQRDPELATTCTRAGTGQCFCRQHSPCWGGRRSFLRIPGFVPPAGPADLWAGALSTALFCIAAAAATPTSQRRRGTAPRITSGPASWVCSPPRCAPSTAPVSPSRGWADSSRLQCPGVGGCVRREAHRSNPQVLVLGVHRSRMSTSFQLLHAQYQFPRERHSATHARKTGDPKTMGPNQDGKCWQCTSTCNGTHKP